MLFLADVLSRVGWYLVDQGGCSVLESTSCTEIRTSLPTFCTLPSTICATPSFRAICFRFSGWLAYFSVEVREITFRSPMSASRVKIRSCMPAPKYSLSGSRERFSNGSTAIDLAGGDVVRSEEDASELQPLMRN